MVMCRPCMTTWRGATVFLLLLITAIFCTYYTYLNSRLPFKLPAVHSEDCIPGRRELARRVMRAQRQVETLAAQSHSTNLRWNDHAREGQEAEKYDGKPARRVRHDDKSHFPRHRRLPQLLVAPHSSTRRVCARDGDSPRNTKTEYSHPLGFS